jgi:hypothetical protein
MNDLGDAVELDVSVLRSENNGFSETDYQIAEIEGDIVSVAIHLWMSSTLPSALSAKRRADESS